jgi:hypothetical protein
VKIARDIEKSLTDTFHWQAFAGAIKENFPEHLRLSIHQSTGEHKVSMSLLNTKTGFTTPWHCSVALMADGEWMSAPMGDFKENPRMKVVDENGRPSYFRELTEEEFQEEGKMRLEAESAQPIEKSADEESQQPERNENFFQWEDVTYDIQNGGKTKRLLDHVDGWLRGGTLTALTVCILFRVSILYTDRDVSQGVSGSGTDILLDVIANRSTTGVVQGDILVNGEVPNISSRNTAGVVFQQDLQFSTATVKEALIFSAILRQPKTTPYAEKITYVEELISLIGLEELADSPVGQSGESE